MNKIVVMILIFITLTAGVCEMVPMSDPIEKDEIRGKFYANFSSGKEDIIEFIDDSSYIRYLCTFNDTVYIDTGKWEALYHSNTNVGIIFPQFINRYQIQDKGFNKYYDKEGGIYDTTARCKSTRIWKDSTRNQIVYTLGERYGKAWIRVDTLKN